MSEIKHLKSELVLQQKVLDSAENTIDLYRDQLAELKSENERLRDCLLSERNRIEWQGETINKLQAHNAMLVEAATIACLYLDANHHSHRTVCNALNATSESIQQWLDKHDAEALLRAADEVKVG